MRSTPREQEAATPHYRSLNISRLMLSSTLVDEAGVHDPGDSSDKLLLDIKGTISEFELEGIKARLIGGQRSKAARGELRISLPIGLAYDEDGKVVLDGDRQIVEAIRLVFQAFRDKGSAMATAKWFRAEGLRLPSRPQSGPARGELHWNLPDHARVTRVLKNPRYAGAFSYGRTTQRRQAAGNVQHVTLPREQWQVCIPDLHEGTAAALDPLPVELAELRVAVAARMDLKVLLPEQLQRDAVALQFPVEVGAVRPDPVAHRRRAGKQLRLERRIVQFGRQRPAQPLLRRPLQIQRDRAHADGAGLGYRPVGQPPLVLEP